MWRVKLQIQIEENGLKNNCEPQSEYFFEKIKQNSHTQTIRHKINRQDHINIRDFC